MQLRGRASSIVWREMERRKEGERREGGRRGGGGERKEEGKRSRSQVKGVHLNKKTYRQITKER